MPSDPAPRRSLFAVWRWPWWVWALFAAVNIAYTVSMVPAAYIMQRCRVDDETYHAVLDTAFAPHVWAHDNLPGVRDFDNWQFSVLVGIFGRAE